MGEPFTFGLLLGRHLPVNGTEAARARSADLAPWPVIATVLTRAAPAIAAVSLLAGAVTLWATSNRDRPEASSRLGLTDEVVWPFYDQVRDELSVAVDDPSVRDRVADAVQGADFDLRVETPIDQTYIDVIASASDTNTAVAASDAAAEQLVERSTGTGGRSQQIQLQSIQDELEVVDRRVADLQATIRASFDATVALGDGSDPGTSVRRQELQSQRSTLGAELDELTRRRVQLDSDARQLQRQIDAKQPEAEVVRRAGAVSGGSDSFGRPIAAGLAAAVLTALGAILVDRYRGRVRNAWYVEGAGGVELLADLRAGQQQLGGANELAARLDEAFLHGDDAVLRGRVVGVASVRPTLPPASQLVVDALRVAGHDAAITVPDPISGFESGQPDAATRVVPIDRALDRAEQHRRARTAAALVLVVTDGHRVDELRRTAAWTRQLPAPLVGAVLVDDVIAEPAADTDGRDRTEEDDERAVVMDATRR